ncbi:MAG: HAD family hydrolase [Firmicutes bacterium]|nr:HAD family hydrolase [Bacillota bacterium]
MIVTDLDSTLLRNDKTISRYTIDTFRRLQENGVKIVIATARPKRVAKDYIGAINADAAILHNGAVIYVGDNHFCSFSIPNKVAVDILQKTAAQYPEMYISVEINDMLYANFEIPAPDWANVRTDFTDLPDMPADKMLFSIGNITNPAESKNNADGMASLKAIQSMLTDNFNAILGEGWLLMVMNKLACKYQGVKEVSAYFGLTPADVIAFGDDINDIEMLKNCGIGVAVANAIDEVKAAADFVCESNENDGVAKWLEEKIYPLISHPRV